MKTPFFLVLLLFTLQGFNLLAQHSITPLSIDCWAVNQNQINPTSTNIEHYGCINSPGTSTVLISGNKSVDFISGKEVHLKPGFEVSNLSGAGKFHAAIKEKELSLAIYNPINTPGEVPIHEKLEIGVKLPNDINQKIINFITNQPHLDQINPFDPEQISVEATFTSMNPTTIYSTKDVFGFYYKEFNRNLSTLLWDEDTTSFPFRIRYAPMNLGNHKCEIKVVTPTQTWTALTFYFNVVNSSNEGFVYIKNPGTKNGRYLSYSTTGNTYFAIGENMDWAPGISSSSKPEYINYYNQIHGIPLSTNGDLQSHLYQYYDLWMGQIADNGANHMAFLLTPEKHRIEKVLGNYTTGMPDAWEIDYIVNLAHEKGIYLSFGHLIHSMFKLSGNNPIWNNNPYKSTNQNSISGINEPIDFFTNQDAIDQYKKAIRYYISRWGYSPNIAIWELLTEINVALEQYDGDEDIREDFKDWFIEIRNYIRNDLNDHHLISGSYKKDSQTEKISQRIFSESDVTMLHYYGANRNTNWEGRYEVVKKMLNSNKTYQFGDQPVIFDEMGAGTHPTLDYCSDLTFHHNLWATSMMGCFGSGFNWWWDNALHPTGAYHNFKAISTFFEGEDLNAQSYTQQREKEVGLLRNSRYEIFYLVSNNKTKSLGWLHNTSYQWFNQYGSNSCITQCVDNGNGLHVDTGDYPTNSDNAGPDYNAVYNNGPNNATGHFTNYSPLHVRIGGLKASIPFFPKNYRIDWYSTEGSGQFISSSTERTNAFGVAEFFVPGFSSYGDVSFKIYHLPSYNEQLESFEDTDEVVNFLVVNDSNTVEKNEIINCITFPNPSNEKLEIKCPNKIKKLELISSIGTVVHECKENLSNLVIDTRLFNSGLYILKIETNDSKIIYEKIIIQH